MKHGAACHDTRSLGQCQFCSLDDLIERPSMLSPYLCSFAQVFGEFVQDLAMKTRFIIQFGDSFTLLISCLWKARISFGISSGQCSSKI